MTDNKKIESRMHPLFTAEDCEGTIYLNKSYIDLHKVNARLAPLLEKVEKLEDANAKLRAKLERTKEHALRRRIENEALEQEIYGELLDERDALAAKLAALEKEIAEAPFLYKTEGDAIEWWPNYTQGDTHRARLVRVERIDNKE